MVSILGYVGHDSTYTRNGIKGRFLSLCDVSYHSTTSNTSKMETIYLTLGLALVSMANGNFLELGECPPKPAVVQSLGVERVTFQNI